MLLNKGFLFFAVGLLFFVFSLLTINDYGISWDEPTHFKRGQGYLWYLLTSDNDYSKLPAYNLSRAQNDPQYHERSIYQDERHNAAFYRTIDGTHPPLADILSSATNMIFYQKLGWLGDIESYHLFEIFVASLGVAALFLFVFESFGPRAAIFSTILFATYPLFWGESHFNIKDPVETSWIILTLYFLWKGVKSQSVRFILISSVFAGFGLSTKFNVIFLPLIVLPWLMLIFKMYKREFRAFLKTRRFILAGLLYPIIVFAIFYLSYPFLWENTVENIGKVLTYYRRNALDPAFANSALADWSFYPLRWVVLTAPPLVLLGFLLSLISLKKLINQHHGFILLIFLWFAVTIIRVSIPGVNIYGGVRQIMEYIPAISILAGLGFARLLFGRSKMVTLGTLLIVITLSLYQLVRLHPNENVYFNFLAGGLKGAVGAGVPAAGNSFGNAYYQGVQWINENSTSNAKLALLQGSEVNIPKNKLRSDISLSNGHFSGINREGEYLIELTFNHEHRQNFYAWEYVEKFLEPVYVVRADNTPILKVWKNDPEHTRSEYRLVENVLDNTLNLSKEGNKLEIKIEKEVLLSRVILSYDLFDKCVLPEVSVVETSLDGIDWKREKDPLSFLQVGKNVSSFKPAWDNSALETKYNLLQSTMSKTIVFYFAGREARYIRFILDNEKSCILNNPVVEIKVLAPTLNENSKT